MKLTRVLCVALLLVVAVPALMLAQAQTSGAISGKVTDEAGNPISGATVTVTSRQLGVEREQKTDVNGLFKFALLPVGLALLLTYVEPRAMLPGASSSPQLAETTWTRFRWLALPPLAAPFTCRFGEIAPLN